jgi:hypothetical protein
VATKKSIKQRILEILSQNVGKYVKSDDITKELLSTEWARSLRTLRAEGWDISSYDHQEKGYILRSLKKKESEKNRVAINRKLRYQILHRDNSRCQKCGVSATEGAKLHIDHKIPVDWGGITVEENLWTLCEDCNLGKKNLFGDLEDDVMKQVVMEESGHYRIKKYFELKPDTPVDPDELAVISNIRDWTRTLRNVRQKEKMDIDWVAKEKGYPKGYYIYRKNGK